MRLANSGKACGSPAHAVAVIASLADLRRALRLRRGPDLFELRLDALAGSAGELEACLPSLRAPLILTARHPAEGGTNNLKPAQRRALLLRFLHCAEYVDIELRSLGTSGAVREEAARLKRKLIVSVHDFSGTPPLRRLQVLAARAHAAAANVFKLVTRVDTAADLARLLAAFDAASAQLPVSAMGVGKLGRESRRALLARGSVLNYAHLGSAQTDGQLSLTELRETMRAR